MTPKAIQIKLNGVEFILMRPSDYDAFLRTMSTWHYEGIIPKDGGHKSLEGSVRIVNTGDAQTDFNVAYMSAREDAKRMYELDLRAKVTEWKVWKDGEK